MMTANVKFSERSAAGAESAATQGSASADPKRGEIEC